MPINDRASFVSSEFRFETVEDLAVRATYASAREVVLPTSMNAANAATLANAIMTESKVAAQVFKVEIQGTYGLEDIEGGPLRFTCDFPTYSPGAGVYKVTSLDVDYFSNTTVLTVRG